MHSICISSTVERNSFNPKPLNNMQNSSSFSRVGLRLSAALASALLLCAGLQAAPSLSVRKPPVVSGANPNTGPAATDPTAVNGQWFDTLTGGAPSVRSREFHDNVPGQGGGTWSHKAIYGAVGTIYYQAGPGTNIIGFIIKATVTNDTNSTSGGWQSSPNSHGEMRGATTPYVGTLYRPVITAEFAVNSSALFPAGPVAGTPYSLSPGPRIIAINHTLNGWYCFNNVAPGGRYYVPAWTLADIPVGASSSVAMQFRVLDGGINPGDPRYSVIVNSLSTGSDVLSNRTTSLKISDWIGSIFTDTGAAYSANGSDSSVFHL